MSKSQEIKVAESLVNLMDDHWFNPTVFGRYMAEQPLHTLDRIMEMVVSVISEQTKMYELYKNRGETTEGLTLANELNECIKAYQQDNSLTNLKLPSRSYTIKKKQEAGQYKFGWRGEELDPFN
jgi:peptidoglycan hydrolase-like amidase